MKSPDEIKKGLECCGIEHRCEICPYKEAGCLDLKLESDALAYIQQLEAAQPKWISVKERLPEPFVSVLVHIPEEEPLPQVHEGFITPDGTWCSVLYVETCDRVTHWMPLPSPPKEDE